MAKLPLDWTYLKSLQLCKKETMRHSSIFSVSFPLRLFPHPALDETLDNTMLLFGAAEGPQSGWAYSLS
jgi:hypothetical protein